MSVPIHVKISSRYQIAVPSQARQQLKLNKGDRLLVDIQDGMLILIPQPRDFALQMAGLHKEIWKDKDTTAYLHEERQAWEESAKS
jgi:AbrB family looped-hinge helix DNA binding protein